MKERKKPIDVLTRHEVRGLMDQCSRRAPTGLRDRALIAILHRCQLRIQEALDLRPSDVSFEYDTITVHSGKGGKKRVVAFPHDAQSELLQWLKARESKLGLNGRQTVFCTLKGRPMSRQAVWNKLDRLKSKTGIEKRIHPHGLRHSGASDMAAKGVPLSQISGQLGHSRMITTETYLHQLNPADRVKSILSYMDEEGSDNE
jgi:site-specific recombinase XerD